MAKLRALVDAEAPGEDKRTGYRVVASLSGLSEEYIYQLYERKPKVDGSPRVMGPRAAKAIARAFAHGRPLNWIDFPPQPVTRIRATNTPVTPEVADLLVRSIVAVYTNLSPEDQDAMVDNLKKGFDSVRDPFDPTPTPTRSEPGKRKK